MNPKKNKKKKKSVKDIQNRKKEIEQLKTKIEGLGLNDNFEGIDVLYKKLDEFVETGISDTFSMNLIGLNRRLDIILSNRVESKINMVYDKSI